MEISTVVFFSFQGRFLSNGIAISDDMPPSLATKFLSRFLGPIESMVLEKIPLIPVISEIVLGFLWGVEFPHREKGTNLIKSITLESVYGACSTGDIANFLCFGSNVSQFFLGNSTEPLEADAKSLPNLISSPTIDVCAMMLDNGSYVHKEGDRNFIFKASLYDSCDSAFLPSLEKLVESLLLRIVAQNPAEFSLSCELMPFKRGVLKKPVTVQVDLYDGRCVVTFSSCSSQVPTGAEQVTDMGTPEAVVVTSLLKFLLAIPGNKVDLVLRERSTFSKEAAGFLSEYLKKSTLNRVVLDFAPGCMWSAKRKDLENMVAAAVTNSKHVVVQRLMGTVPTNRKRIKIKAKNNPDLKSLQFIDCDPILEDIKIKEEKTCLKRKTEQVQTCLPLSSAAYDRGLKKKQKLEIHTPSKKKEFHTDDFFA